MSNSWLIALLFALLIIGSLAYYAGVLLKRVKNQTEEQNKKALLKQAALQKHDSKILASVTIIARAMKEQQCDYSEGCWRLSVLLDSLKLSDSHAQTFPAIFALYEKIKHLAILDSRKDLSKQQRMKQDLERIKAEAKYTDTIEKNLDTLLQYANEQADKFSEVINN